MANAILNIGQTGGQVNISTAAAPATPAAGVVTLYAGTDKALHVKNSDGTDITIAAAGAASPITVVQTCSLVSTAVGGTAASGVNCAVAIGNNAQLFPGATGTIVIGNSSNGATGACNSVVLGNSSRTTAACSIVIGNASCSTHAGGVALGPVITTIRENTTHVNSLVAFGQAASIAHAVGSTGGTATLNWDNSNVQTLTLTSSIPSLTKSNPIDGGVYTVFVTQGGSGGYTVSWGADVKFAGGTGPTLSTAIGATDAVSLVYVAGITGYYGNANLNFA